jgi:hypothetical protein
MDILTFYREVLKGLSCSADREGYISFCEPGGIAKPISIDGRRLVLPTKKRLDDGITEELIAFHPIGENLARKGPSHVLTKMQQIAKARLAQYTLRVSETLMSIAATPSLHKDLSPECSEFLKQTTTADSKTPKVLNELITAALKKNALITVYLKPNGELGDVAYNRLCVVRFPFIETLRDESDETPYGVTMRKKHRKAILGLLDYLFPEGDKIETYSGGSNNQTAPFLEAFLQGFGNLAARFNELIALFGDQVNLDLEPFDLKFMKHLKKIDDFHRAIPILEGNEGNLAKGQEEIEGEYDREAEKAALSIVDREPPWEASRQTPNQQTPAPTSRQAAKAPKEEPRRGLTMEELRQRHQAQAPQQPQMGYPQQQMGYQQSQYAQPPMGYGQPQYQQQPPGWPSPQPQQPMQQGPAYLQGGHPQQPQYQQPQQQSYYQPSGPSGNPYTAV